MWIKRISACWLPPNWSTAYKLTICIILGLMLKHWVESLNGRTQHTFFFFGCVLCNSTPFVNPWISWSVGVFSFGQWWWIQTTFKAKIPATRPKSQPQGPILHIEAQILTQDPNSNPMISLPATKLITKNSGLRALAGLIKLRRHFGPLLLLLILPLPLLILSKKKRDG